MSDFRRNSAIGLRCFNENSVIDDNLKWAWTVGSNIPITFSNIPITLTLALNYGTNFEKAPFKTLVFSVCLVCWHLRIDSGWVLM